MGTWGITAFEDDTAMEFYDRFCMGNQHPEELEIAFDKVLSTVYTIEDPELEGFLDPVKALVFSEIVAKALGNSIDTFPDDEYHEEGDQLLDIDFGKITPLISKEFIEKIKLCIEKIKHTKELHLNELWRDSESYEEWQEYLDGLISRLQV